MSSTTKRSAKKSARKATGTSASKDSGSSSADATKVERHREELDALAEGTIDLGGEAEAPRRRKKGEGPVAESVPEPVSGPITSPLTKEELRPFIEGVTTLVGSVEPELALVARKYPDGKIISELDTLTDGWFPLASKYPDFFRGDAPWPVLLLYGTLITVAIYKPKVEAVQQRKQQEDAAKKRRQAEILRERTSADHAEREAEGRAAEERGRE